MGSLAKLYYAIKEAIRSGYVNNPIVSSVYLVGFVFRKKNIKKIGYLDAAFLKKYFGLSATIVEVGAFNGLDTRKFATIFPDGQVESFEPVPGIFSTAIERLKYFKNVNLYPVAVSNEINLLSIYVSSGTSKASSSILHPVNVDKFFRNIKFQESSRKFVPVFTLDFWNSVRKLKKVDLLWVDAQGSEGLVFEGAEKFLGLVDVIYTEVCFEDVHHGSTKFDDIQLFLARHQFQLCKLWRNGPEGDALFVKQNHSHFQEWFSHFA